jgi:hypothetical protein
MRMRFDRDTFKRLVHHLIWRMGARDGVEAGELNEALWSAEARAYQRRGWPIAGATYVRDTLGPVAREFPAIRDELEAEGKIKVRVERRGDRDVTLCSAGQPPDMTGIDENDIEAIDWTVTSMVKERADSSISDTAPDDPWQIARIGEVQPYHAALATRVRRPRGDELEWARSKARRRVYS